MLLDSSTGSNRVKGEQGLHYNRAHSVRIQKIPDGEIENHGFFVHNTQIQMERREFGPAKRKFSVIGQGTWEIDERDRASAIAALCQGLDAGMRYR